MFGGVGSPLTQTLGLGIFETLTEADFGRLETFFEEGSAPGPKWDRSSAASPAFPSRRKVRPLVAERDGRPVATATLLIHDGGALLAGATHDSVRARAGRAAETARGQARTPPRTAASSA